MPDAKTPEHMSTQLRKVAERAKRDPAERILALAHLIDIAALRRAYDRARKDAAVGVDGVTKEQYGRNLEARLQDLHERLKSKQYRHQPIRRVHIPKESRCDSSWPARSGGSQRDGKTRPIGISAFEDKLVQDAVREVLESIYEQDFMSCSYGFRPGRSPHDAVRTLDAAVNKGRVAWILEADIVTRFPRDAARCARKEGSPSSTASIARR